MLWKNRIRAKFIEDEIGRLEADENEGIRVAATERGAIFVGPGGKTIERDALAAWDALIELPAASGVKATWDALASLRDCEGPDLLNVCREAKRLVGLGKMDQAAKLLEQAVTAPRTPLSVHRSAQIEAAVLEEREACAKLVECYARPPAWIDPSAARGIAREIRARGEGSGEGG